MSEEKPSILCFEKHYSDGSDVEFSVSYYRRPYLHDESQIGFVTLKHIDDINIPMSQIDWIISCLNRIKQESE